ncbi:MAG: GNAT family N-acetyltransferase [Solirubrobacteraceae bacterium]
MPRSVIRATDLDVLPSDRIVERRKGYLVVRSPGNPGHYWGNLLIPDDPPLAGDASRWEHLFAAEFPSATGVRHRTFAWDRTDGALGRAQEEFVARGYALEETVGLIATPDRVVAHPRANRDVLVLALDPFPDRDEALWDQVLELQVADPEELDEETHRSFHRRRLTDVRALFQAGRGAWYVALGGHSGEVWGSCGVVVTGSRGRFQSVDTAAAHRRQGICSRLIVDATHHAAARHGADQLVIGADPNYHALGLYESLGFQRAERVAGVVRAST